MRAEASNPDMNAGCVDILDVSASARYPKGTPRTGCEGQEEHRRARANTIAKLRQAQSRDSRRKLLNREARAR